MNTVRQDIYIGELFDGSEIFEKGDENGDCVVGLADAVRCLYILGGLQTGGLEVCADVDDDCKIGIKEAIYILEKITGIR